MCINTKIRLTILASAFALAAAAPVAFAQGAGTTDKSGIHTYAGAHGVMQKSGGAGSGGMGLLWVPPY